MNRRYINNDDDDDDENDNGDEWSDNCLYRRMLRGSQRIQMMKRRFGGSGKSILEQAFENADIEATIRNHGIKVLRIHIVSKTDKTFDMRYFTIDKTCEHICLTPEPPSQQTPVNPLHNNKKNSTMQSLFIDVADIDAWHVGTVATRRAEVARRLETSRSTNNNFDQMAMEKLLTIYYKGNETLDLVVPVSQQMNMIVSSLNEIHSIFHRTQPWISKESSLLRYICANQISMASEDQMTQAEFHKVCDILQVTGDPAFVFQSRTNQNTLPYHECINMLRTLKPQKTQAMVLWDFLFGADQQTITHKELHHKFLSQIQADGHLSMRQAQALLTFIQTIEVSYPQGGNPQDDTFRRTTLQKDQFEEFLYSDLNDAYDPQIQQMDQRLDQPLSSYWINTSFKTYRTQIGKNGKEICASVEGYMRALIRGAKCLDLDCWDGPTTTPIVGQPKKGMDKLFFRHVCDVVEAYLKMHPGSYPIILSIENYCSPPFQEAMGTILQEVLGHRLVVPQNGNNSWEGGLPSPETLRGRVIFHSKVYPEVLVTTTNEKERFKRQSESKKKRGFTFGWIQRAANTNQKVENIVGALQKLVFLEGGKLEANLETTPSHKILAMARSQQRELLKVGIEEKDHRLHNASHLTRTHPSVVSERVFSNQNPVQAWSLGCQVVALRLDSGDNAVLLNDGLFRQQNGVGYVLKPPFVRGLERKRRISLFVRILGGRCLANNHPKSSGNSHKSQLSVTVTLYDVQTTGDDTEQVYQDSHNTTSVDGSGFAPVWKDRGKKFGVQQPDIAMILFQVMVGGKKTSSISGRNNSSRVSPPLATCVANAAIPVSCLRKGYRSIQFFDDNNCRTGALRYASLLVHIEY